MDGIGQLVLTGENSLYLVQNGYMVPILQLTDRCKAALLKRTIKDA
jgi:hypothetical protein